jgi:hypothetical protein
MLASQKAVKLSLPTHVHATGDDGVHAILSVSHRICNGRFDISEHLTTWILSGQKMLGSLWEEDLRVKTRFTLVTVGGD